VRTGRRESLARLREEDLAAQRNRLATVPIEQRLLEAIAWSAALLADEIRRGRAKGIRRERALPSGLGTRVR
jgi:hypothetical protein